MTGMASESWLVLAQDDLATAEALLGTMPRLCLRIGLQCHGAVKKVLTAAYIQHHGKAPVETEGIEHLLAKLPGTTDREARILQTIEWLNTYPILQSMESQDLGDLAALLTQEKTVELLGRTKELCEWIKARL